MLNLLASCVLKVDPHEIREGRYGGTGCPCIYNVFAPVFNLVLPLNSPRVFLASCLGRMPRSPLARRSLVGNGNETRSKDRDRFSSNWYNIGWENWLGQSEFFFKRFGKNWFESFYSNCLKLQTLFRHISRIFFFFFLNHLTRCLIRCLISKIGINNN